MIAWFWLVAVPKTDLDNQKFYLAISRGSGISHEIVSSGNTFLTLLSGRPCRDLLISVKNPLIYK